MKGKIGSTSNSQTSIFKLERDGSHESPSIIPKTRAVASFHEPSESNPFSPKKSRGRQNSYTDNTPLPSLSFEITSTPIKKRIHSTPSPDASTPYRSSASKQLILQTEPGANTDAVKARKRLRGEAVSPSPKRLDKKHRISLARPESCPTESYSSTGDLEADYAVGQRTSETSFVVDSPVKRSRNGKHFKSLFEEENFPKQVAPQKVPEQPRSTLISASKFREREAIPRKGDPKGQITAPIGPKARTIICRSASMVDSDDSAGPSGRKRSSSADRIDSPRPKEVSDTLLPPSPTTSTSQARATGTMKAKKRQKIVSEGVSSDHSMSEESLDIPIIEMKAGSRLKLRTRANDYDSETDSYEHIFENPPIDMPSFTEPQASETKISVDLPDDLRTVLHISPSRAREREELVLAESVLHGIREPLQRGLVWGAGEIEDSCDAVTDGEDDWAGEGVPWEVGEL